ncbi:MAG: RecX family transcriptional regulator [Candidatus Cloacimonadota bacterium]|nr:RecX family transcriptional regulator [Candidatus Cloacimonadota bacterium]
MNLKLKNKSKTIYWIYFDDDIWGILPGKVLHFFDLTQAGEYDIDNTSYQKIQNELEKFAWEKLLKYLAYKERSRKECEQYLKKLGFRPKLIEKLLQRSEKYNYINEKRFAELFCQNQIGKGKSQREVKTKLFSKGIDEKLINQVLTENYSQQKKEEILEKNIKKAIRKYSNLEERKRKEKIINYMVRKGFGYYDIIEKLDK